MVSYSDTSNKKCEAVAKTKKMDVGTEPWLCNSRVELSKRFQYVQKSLKKVQVALNGARQGTGFSPKDPWWAFMQHEMR